MMVCEVGDSPIYSLCFAADGTLIAGTKDGRILSVQPGAEPRLLFETATLCKPNYQDSAVNALCAHSNGRVFAATQIGYGHTGTTANPGDSAWTAPWAASSIALWNEDTLAVGKWDRNRPGGGHFLFCAWKSKAQGVSPAAHRSLDHFVKFNEPKGVRAVAVSRAAELVAWSTGHQKIQFWNPRGQDLTSLAIKHTSPAIAFHPDGTRLVAAQEWGASVFDVAKRHELYKLAGHTGRVTCLAYRPDGHGLATGSWDGTVRLWDVTTGLPIASLSSPAGRIFTLAWSPDGLRLAAAGDAGNITVWDTD